jgi:hypothetical protein
MSRRTATAAAERAAKATTSRHVSLLWPPALWIAMWLFAELTYLLFHYVLPDYLPHMAGFVMLAGVGITGAVWKMSWDRVKNKRNDTHAIRGTVYATTTAAAAVLWLFFGMIGNPLAPGLAVTWIFGGLFVVILWLIRMVMERKDAEAHASGQPSRRGAAAEFLEQVTGVQNVDARVLEASEDRVDIEFDTTESDIEPEELRAAAGKIAAAAGLPRTRAVVIPDSGHAGKGTVRLVRKDVLREPLPWPGPSCPGGTAFDPYLMGKYLDTMPAQLYVADPTGARHHGVVGMPGSGKTNGCLVEMAEHISRRQISVTAMATMKGRMMFKPLAAGIDWYIGDHDTARALLSKPITRALEARFDHLADMNLTEWEPDCGLQFWVIQMEEASFLEVPDSYLEDLGKAMRAAGARLRYSLQSSLHTEMSTTLRRMLSQWSVYGCQDEFEAGVLPEAVRNAGASPEQWRDEQPGTNYLSAKGILLERQVTPLRDYQPTWTQLVQVANQYGSQPLDDVTANALGGLYLDRPSPVAVLNGQSSPVSAPAREQIKTTTPTSPGTGMTMDQHDPDDDGRPTELDMVTDEELGETTPYEGLPMELSREDVREFEPVVRTEDDRPVGPARPAVRAVYTPDETSVEWMRQAVDRQIDEWERQGRRWIRPSDFVDTDLCGDLGPRTRGRTWFNKEFKNRLAGPHGRLRYDDEVGKYWIEAQGAQASATASR